MKDSTTKTLRAAYRMLRTTSQLWSARFIPETNPEEWLDKRTSIIIELYYDIYDNILYPYIEKYKNNKLSKNESRMLASAIKYIAEQLDFCTTLPWEEECRLEDDNRTKTIIEFLCNSRQIISSFIGKLHVSDIQELKDCAGQVIGIIAPDTKFLEDKILLKIHLPRERGNYNYFEMTIIEEGGHLAVSPIVTGPFFYHFEPKKVNIETGEVLNKIKYDFYNYSIDLKT